MKKVKLCRGGSMNVQSLYLMVQIVVVKWRRLEEVMALSTSFCIACTYSFWKSSLFTGVGTTVDGATVNHYRES
jgi:hypothetical protein